LKKGKTNASSNFEKRYSDLIKNDTRYGIIMALKTYGSQNIKVLAEILGKTESTIFHHLEELRREPKIVEMDVEKTQTKRGKYFKLTEPTLSEYAKDLTKTYQEDIPKMLKKFEEYTQEQLYDEVVTMLKNNPNLGKMTKSTRRVLSYHHNIEKFILNNFERSEKFLLEGKMPVRKDIPLGDYTLMSEQIKIYDSKHVLHLSRLTTEYFSKLHNLKKEIESEIKEKGILEDSIVTEYVYLFGGGLGNFPFA
jgi:DNA-binding MarR family transcriptional regulator